MKRALVLLAAVLAGGIGGALFGGPATTPITLRPTDPVAPSRVAVADARPGRPKPEVIGDWFGRAIILADGLTVCGMVADAVGKTLPDARVELKTFWIAAEFKGGKAPVPMIVGRLRIKIIHGAKNQEITSAGQCTGQQPTDDDFRMVLDDLLSAIKGWTAMMQQTGEL